MVKEINKISQEEKDKIRNANKKKKNKLSKKIKKQLILNSEEKVKE